MSSRVWLCVVAGLTVVLATGCTDDHGSGSGSGSKSRPGTAESGGGSAEYEVQRFSGAGGASDSGAAGSCDPNYSGCVPLVGYDLDCSDVNGPLTVFGSDPHGFDRDGDGRGCESG